MYFIANKNYSNFNIYKVIISDQMHTLNLGLFKYMLDYIRKLLYKQCEDYVLQTFEQRLIAIPRYRDLKIMKSIDLTQDPGHL